MGLWDDVTGEMSSEELLQRQWAEYASVALAELQRKQESLIEELVHSLKRLNVQAEKIELKKSVYSGLRYKSKSYFPKRYIFGWPISGGYYVVTPDGELRVLYRLAGSGGPDQGAREELPIRDTDVDGNLILTGNSFENLIRATLKRHM